VTQARRISSMVAILEGASARLAHKRHGLEEQRAADVGF